MRNLKLYHDELFYSYLARYRVRLNLLSYEDFSRYMYVYPEVRPECLFTNTLRPKIFEEITAGLAWKDVIDNHTMIPEYRFEKKEKFEHGYQILLERGSRNYQYITDKHIEDRTLRYCPACALEERKKYGEAYWHRLPQIRGMKTCPEHHCYLMDSSVTLSRHCVANIYPAELVIPEDAAPVKCTNEKEAELANYYKEVFEAPININAPIPVGRFLGMSLSDKYRVGRSKKYMYRDSAVKDITAIQRDLSVFLEEREQRSMDASVSG